MSALAPLSLSLMATRKSSRIQGNRDNPNKIDNSNPEDVQAKPARKAKRAKTAATAIQASTASNPEVTRRRRGNRGLLEELAKEAPLDILLEVLKHLEFRDILHLSRTNKYFRELLIVSRSLSIWREARENTPNLPPLPVDLNEMQYASLLFDNHCHACLRSPCDNVIWEFRVRCHKNCMSQLFMAYENRPARLKNIDFRKVVEHIPFYDEQIDRTDGPFWFTPMFKRLLAEYREIQRDKSAVKEWNEEKKQHFELITSHARECHTWDTNRRTERDAEQETLRKERRQEIITRLSASGWGQEELNHEEFVSHPLFKPPKAVTERIWNNLEPQLVDSLQGLKDRRLDEERRCSLKSRYRLLELAYEDKGDRDRLTVYPPISDLINAQLGVIDDMIWNTPHDEKLTKSDFVNVLRATEADFAAFSRKWVKQKSQELVKLLRKFKGGYDLRSTIFSCEHCGDKTWAPRIFMHHCSVYHNRLDSGRWDRPEFNPFSELSYGWWRADAFSPNVLLSGKVKEIMALCGTPELESIDDLEREDPLFECLDRTGHNGKRCFARWMEAMMRSLKGDQVVLTTIDDDTKNRILTLEKAYERRRCPGYVVCKHCPPDTTAFELYSTKIWSHLRAKHGIDSMNVKRNVDWCYGLQARVFSLRPPTVTLVESDN
ncbi:hypothetical protein E1B28_002944 [Marasmius oreades]|uniref:F-box domain-containing protein n=1 Tax=Marasmius oreades TaxID=181124 RepID=A0A9P7RKH8_9AGAR|nr:uncharacterized protein E1B28_002944 [Marasmius oreades]KAG7085380.1 hypothetical protein E1B28_002944 [Marasmius oreades]